MIDPKDVIKRLSVERLCQTAEDYYHRIVDPRQQMGKPFSSALEAPELLLNLGLLFSGLQLGKTMSVLDFGAGTCWLSRYLNQLGCVTISLDCSRTALELGRRLFREHPLISDPVAEPTFLAFDGQHIELDDNSVERIVCFDTFHHVPNPARVLDEMARVLKEGGIAGFAEPGRKHSQIPQSQFEMTHYQVLENDVDLDEIYPLARRAGFSEARCLLSGRREVSVPEYLAMIDHSWSRRFGKEILNHVAELGNSKTIFFLYKGRPVPDSRNHVGLSHQLQAAQSEYQARSGEPLKISITVTNTGQARWLCRNLKSIGVVNLGAHLCDAAGALINLDFSRSSLPQDVAPGETFNQTIPLSFDRPGRYRVALDLVAEHVCWFESVGSQPLWITVEVG